MKKTYTVGIGSVQPYLCKEIMAETARKARWLYVNLYAPPGTKYSDTWCNSVKAQQRKSVHIVK
jgi:hypothetical protein